MLELPSARSRLHPSAPTVGSVDNLLELLTREVEGLSLYQVQQCVFDYLRVLEDPATQGRPDISLEGYDLTDDERKALATKDIGALYVMGTHPVMINGLCRALGYKRADYRPLLVAAATHQEPRKTRWQTS